MQGEQRKSSSGMNSRVYEGQHPRLCTTLWLEISFAGRKKINARAYRFHSRSGLSYKTYPATKKMCQPFGCCVSVWVQFTFDE
jgi:hypothetical protein